MEAAGLVADYAEEAGDAYVTLLVHAGIAAADVVCCEELRKHAQGENHAEAVGLLAGVKGDGAELAKAPGTLVASKSRAGYGHEPVTRETCVRCERAAHKLVQAARTRIASSAGPIRR